MLRLERAALAALMLVAAMAGHAQPDAVAPLPSPFIATYTVEWRGFTAGYSTLELKQAGSNDFVYSSRNNARGIFKLVFPNPITQESRFTIENGQVVPSRYQASDGSSDPSKVVSLRFDWSARRVRGAAEAKPVDLALQPGTQDDLSVQIALMLGLKSGHVPASFWLINKDEVQEYQYSRDGAETLDTPVGKLEAVIYRSHHAGSSRTTRLWLAPSLDYMPLRAEQTRHDKIEFAMSIRSFKKS